MLLSYQKQIAVDRKWSKSNMSEIKNIVAKILIFVSMFCIFVSEIYADNFLKSSQQMVMVVGKDWKASSGILQRYERSNKDSSWQKIGDQVNVNLGKNEWYGMGFRVTQRAFRDRWSNM